MVRYIYFLLFVLSLFGCSRKGIVNTCKDTSNAVTNINGSNHNNIVTENNNPYADAYASLERMLLEKEQINFKKAVFLTENCWYENRNDYNKFCNSVDNISSLILSLSRLRRINYVLSDSIKVSKNAALFFFFTDTTIVLSSDTPYYAKVHYPFKYNLDDYTGEKDWSNMFVTKLLKTNKGNCHSLPYLYKIIADEIGAEAYLSLAPNHIYIKHRSKKTGWYNTELTSGQFPMDGWIMASGYIPLEAIQNGIYMDTLSSKQNICLCLIDLAKGYEKKFGSDDFVTKCCDLALQYYPNYINALLLKAETTKKKFDRLIKQYNVEYVSDLFYNPGIKNEYEDMEQLYLKIFDLGYREMPKEMYQQWLESANNEKNIYGKK